MSNNLFCNTSITLNNRYKILNPLGENGGKYTFLANDLSTEQLVVIKTLIFNEEIRGEDLKLFEREAETLKNLSHPAIPRYIDYFELDMSDIKGFALVQTYIEAKSLQEQLGYGRNFNEQEIKQLGKSLLEVLDYLHSRQPAVIHRDIKPSNILLKNRTGNSVGDAYLVDFGSVQTTIRTSSTRTVVGTYGYMPPEQFGGRAFPASDLYSLGATLIYLVTKKHPAELLDDDLNIQFEYINNISFDFKKWLVLMTQPSLNRRFNSSKTALQLLDNLSNINREESYQFSKFNKPKNSKIKLERTSKKLEIILHRKSLITIINTTIGTFFAISVKIVFVIISIGFVFSSWVLVAALLPKVLGELLLIILRNIINIILILRAVIIPYILVFLGITLASYIIYLLLTGFLEKVHISVDKKYIVVAKKIFGSQSLNWSYSTMIARDKIWKLLSTSQSYKLINSEKIVEKNIKEVPDLVIWEGTIKEYNLNSYLNRPLSLAERDWIAQELSDFLNIPLIEE